MLLWIYTCAFILCSYCITSSSIFAMLHNVNLNTLTLCLSICNRMAPPTQHLLYPLLDVQYDDQHRAHILSDTDAQVALPPLRPRTHTRGAPVERALCAVHTACWLSRACPCCQLRSSAPWPSTTYCSYRQVQVSSLYVNILIPNLR